MSANPPIPLSFLDAKADFNMEFESLPVVLDDKAIEGINSAVAAANSAHDPSCQLWALCSTILFQKLFQRSA